MRFLSYSSTHLLALFTPAGVCCVRGVGLSRIRRTRREQDFRKSHHPSMLINKTWIHPQFVTCIALGFPSEYRTCLGVSPSRHVSLVPAALSFNLQYLPSFVTVLFDETLHSARVARRLFTSSLLLDETAKQK